MTIDAGGVVRDLDAVLATACAGAVRAAASSGGHVAPMLHLLGVADGDRVAAFAVEDSAQLLEAIRVVVSDADPDVLVFTAEAFTLADAPAQVTVDEGPVAAMQSAWAHGVEAVDRVLAVLVRARSGDSRGVRIPMVVDDQGELAVADPLREPSDDGPDWGSFGSVVDAAWFSALFVPGRVAQGRADRVGAVLLPAR